MKKYIDPQLVEKIISESPVAGSLDPVEFKKLQLDTIIELIDLILEEHENHVLLTLDKQKEE